MKENHAGGGEEEGEEQGEGQEEGQGEYLIIFINLKIILMF